MSCFYRSLFTMTLSPWLGVGVFLVYTYYAHSPRMFRFNWIGCRSIYNMQKMVSLSTLLSMCSLSIYLEELRRLVLHVHVLTMLVYKCTSEAYIYNFPGPVLVWLKIYNNPIKLFSWLSLLRSLESCYILLLAVYWPYLMWPTLFDGMGFPASTD
jgi:hypothetical protein